jgi:hypothetical protein
MASTHSCSFDVTHELYGWNMADYLPGAEDPNIKPLGDDVVCGRVGLRGSDRWAQVWTRDTCEI